MFNISPVLKPLLDRYKNLTAYLMPEAVRGQFDLPADTPKNRRKFENDLAVIRKAYPYLPRHLKYLTTYMEAQRRLRGKHSPGLLPAL